MAGLPDLLTVEEAARLIRVGRTKAYAMAQEWRTTNGRSGLPVVDFGHVLRVPRKALEQIIGAELEELTAEPPSSCGEREAAVHTELAESSIAGHPAEAPAEPHQACVEAETPTASRPARQSRRSRVQSPNQASLFESPVPTPKP